MATPDDAGLPESVKGSVQVCYRSAGIGVWGAVLRYGGMPLEKIAIISNSSQVSGSGQLAQAFKITFKDGAMAPFKVSDCPACWHAPDCKECAGFCLLYTLSTGWNCLSLPPNPSLLPPPTHLPVLPPPWSGTLGGPATFHHRRGSLDCAPPVPPLQVVGSASLVAWFLQYSVMGFVFQSCDRGLSAALGVSS